MKRILKSRITSTISLIIGLVTSFVLIFLIVFHTDFFARRASAMFSRYFFGGTNFSLKIDKISGNPVKKIEMTGLYIRFNGPDYSYDVVRLEKLVCEYDIRSIMSGKPEIEMIRLEKPHVWIKPDSSGINIIPAVKGAESGGSGIFEVRNLKVKDGQFIFQRRGSADAIRRLDIDGSLVSGREGIRVTVNSGSFEDIRRDLLFRNIRGGLRWDLADDEYGYTGNEIRISDFYVELDESTMMINGSVIPDSMFVDLNLAAEPFDVEEITRALGIKTSHFGEIQGAISVRGVPGKYRVRGMVNGIFSGFALESFRLDLDYDAPVLRMNRGWGNFNGSYVDGRGELVLGDEKAFSVEFTGSGLDLSAGFFRGSNIVKTDLSGSFSLRYGLSGNGISFDADLSEGHVRNFPFRSGKVRGSYNDGNIHFDLLDLDSPTHSVDSHGDIWTDGSLKLYFDLECAKEDTLFGYFDIEDYRAGLDINGIWEGRFSDWDIITNGTFSELEYWQFDVAGGTANLMMSKGEGFGLQMEMKGDSCRLASKPFSDLGLSLEFSEGVTTIRNLELERPGLRITTGGKIGIVDDGVEISVDEGSIDVFGGQWLAGGTPVVGIKGDLVTIEDLQLHSRSGALFVSGALDNGTGNLDGSLDFSRLNLSLINESGLSETTFQGRVEGSVVCSGELNDPDFTFRIGSTQATIDTFRIDRFDLYAEYGDGSLAIDTLSLFSRGGDLRLEGELRGVRPSGIYRQGIDALKSGTVDIDVDCAGIETYPLLSLMKRSPLKKGKYTGSISVTDSIAHPVVAIDGRFDSLSVEHLVAPAVDIHAALRPGILSLAGNIDMSGDQSGEFRGTVPVADSEWFYRLDYSDPLFIELALDEGDLSVIPGVTDLVAEAAGRYSLRLLVDGTLGDPGLNGQLTLKDAGFRFSGTEERFRNVQASIAIKDTTISISRLEGNEGSKGSFNIDGTVTLDGWRPSDYDISARLDKVLVASIPDVMAIATGDLKVGSQEMDGRKIPSVTGLLDINSSEIYFSFGDYSSTQNRTTMELPSWLAEIELEVRGNTWIKTPDANVEMQGHVTLHKDRRGIYLRGTLDLMRGWYMVYNNKFRVTSGRLEFVRAEGIRPVVDIEAETFDPEGNRIYLVLSWHQDDVEPRLALFHEDPGYSETDIWKMLGGGVVGSDNGTGGWDALNTAQNLAVNYIEKMLNSRMEGITIELETSGGVGGASEGFEPNETVVAIGKYLSEGLYVKYKQGLSITTARHFEVEYRISRLFQIRSEIIMHSEKLINGRSQRTGDEYNVDLKLRWEF